MDLENYDDTDAILSSPPPARILPKGSLIHTFVTEPRGSTIIQPYVGSYAIPPSGRTSDASVDVEDIDNVRDILLQRRRSRQSTVINPDSTAYNALKMLKLAVQDHEIPVRMAYKQLDELAANAERVKASIEKNRSLLHMQVKKHTNRYTKSAFTGWRLYAERKVKQRAVLQRAKSMLMQGLLSRAFKSWCLHVLRNRKTKRMQSSVEKILRRHLLRRLWKAWTCFVKQNLQKDEERRTQKRLLKDMNCKLQEKIGRRAQSYLRTRRLKRMFLAFRKGCTLSKLKQQYLDGIQRRMLRKKGVRVIKMWEFVIQRELFYKRVVNQFRHRRLAACFRAWKNREIQIDGVFEKMPRQLYLLILFKHWANCVVKTKQKEKIVKRKRLIWLFNALREGCDYRKYRKVFKARLDRRANNSRIRRAFNAWCIYMQIRNEKENAQMKEYLSAVEKENERSKEEVKRLSQVLDNGEWGRQQISELVDAKNALANEREALKSLIDQIQQQQAFVLEQKQKNDLEMRQFKDQMLGNNFMQQNKMLIKGASSFNTVVRALKMDAQRKGIDPDYVYTTDRLALDKVAVFPDGEIRVKPVHNFEKGKWVSKNGTDATSSRTELFSSQRSYAGSR